MSTPELALIVEPAELEPRLGEPGLLVVDMCKSSTYLQYHVPGAVHLDYGDIVVSRNPVNGLLPSTALLEQLLSRIGIGPETRVVAYDDEGGGHAARLIWTLDVLGHRTASLLNGGLFSWANEGHPLETDQVAPQPAQFRARFDPEPLADAEFILQRLNDPELALVDARSPAEYSGERRYSARGGHIPGAVNWDWVNLMDQRRNLRLRPAAELRQALAGFGVRPEQTLVAYCQTHHRSSLMYVALRSLGYPRVKGYPGSWSDWGNRSDTPIAAE